MFIVRCLLVVLKRLSVFDKDCFFINDKSGLDDPETKSVDLDHEFIFFQLKKPIDPLEITSS